MVGRNGGKDRVCLPGLWKNTPTLLIGSLACEDVWVEQHVHVQVCVCVCVHVYVCVYVCVCVCVCVCVIKTL